MDFFIKILFFGLIFQITQHQNIYAQSKYDETWVFRAEIKEGNSLFTVILQKDSLQRYTKGYIYTVHKKIHFDSIQITKYGFDLHLNKQNTILSCNYGIMRNQISGTWTRYENNEKITSNISGELEPYSNPLENSKLHYNKNDLKGRWEITFEDNTKGMLMFDNHEVSKVITAKIYTSFGNFEQLEGFHTWNEYSEGMLYMFEFDGIKATTIRGRSDSTKNNISGKFITHLHALNFKAKRNADFLFPKK